MLTALIFNTSHSYWCWACFTSHDEIIYECEVTFAKV